jgi:hypothetical protein
VGFDVSGKANLQCRQKMTHCKFRKGTVQERPTFNMKTFFAVQQYKTINSYWQQCLVGFRLRVKESVAEIHE